MIEYVSQLKIAFIRIQEPHKHSKNLKENNIDSYPFYPSRVWGEEDEEKVREYYSPERFKILRKEINYIKHQCIRQS